MATNAKLHLVSERALKWDVSRSLTSRIPVTGSADYYFSFLYPNFAYAANLVLPYQGALDKIACENGDAVMITRTKTAKKYVKGHKPRTWASTKVVAEPDHYIEDFEIRATSKYNRKTGYINKIPHAEDKLHEGKSQMFNEISASFWCARGKSVDRRSCTATGYIKTKQFPLACKAFRLQNF